MWMPLRPFLRFGTPPVVKTLLDTPSSLTQYCKLLKKVRFPLPSGLQDPRYTEEKKRLIAEKKTQEEVFAEGVQIGSNLKLLAERRTDIFGMEETFIGQKIGEEEIPKPASVQWDGHSSR